MNFDRLAPHYDWMEALTAGGRLQKARTAWLGELAGRRRILSAGEGHGRFAAACTARFPDAEITCVEASARMLAQAKKRVSDPTANIRWHCEDLLNWEPTGKYDAIVTCFFLDCFPPETLAATIAKLAACATEDAIWVVVDFAIPAQGAARWRARAVHALMYAFFRRAVALPARQWTPPDEQLQIQGFRLRRETQSDWGLLRAQLWRHG